MGIIIAIIFYILFFCRVCVPFLHGPDYQLHSDDCRVTEEGLPETCSLDLLSRGGQGQIFSGDDSGRRITVPGPSREENKPGTSGSFPERTQIFLIFCSFPWKTVDKPGFPRYTNRAALNGSKCAQKRHPRQRARNEGVEIRE